MFTERKIVKNVFFVFAGSALSLLFCHSMCFIALNRIVNWLFNDI